MGVCVGDLDQRDLARLRTELVEIIAARFTYPPYYDYRAGAAHVRPVGAARRQEIVTFVQAIILEPLARIEIGAPEMRRFLEQVFTRFVELNPDLARDPARRKVGAMRADIPRAAAEAQRGLVALTTGAAGSASAAAGNFGAPQPTRSWTGNAQTNAHQPLEWAYVERNTRLLQVALSMPPGAQPPYAADESAPAPQWAGRQAVGRQAAPAPQQAPQQAAQQTWQRQPEDATHDRTIGHDMARDADDPKMPAWLTEAATDPSVAAVPPEPSAPSLPPTPAAPAAPTSWATVARDETAPLPAHLMQLNRSLFEGLESGSQSGLFGLDDELGLSDQPTSRQPSVGVNDTLATPQEIPPDLIALYSEYLRDLQPGMPAQPLVADGQTPAAGLEQTAAYAADDGAANGALDWARGPVVSARPPAATRAGVQAAAAATAAASDPAAADRAIFAQLRQQLEAYLRQTARQYGVRVHGSDGAYVLAALRQAGILDASDLRLAEGILALTARIGQGQGATLEDYRQALTLYLLYHRRHVGA